MKSKEGEILDPTDALLELQKAKIKNDEALDERVADLCNEINLQMKKGFKWYRQHTISDFDTEVFNRVEVQLKAKGYTASWGWEKDGDRKIAGIRWDHKLLKDLNCQNREPW